MERNVAALRAIAGFIVQVPVNDPLLLIPAMAYVTRNLGFGVTCAVSYEHPYARRVGSEASSVGSAVARCGEVLGVRSVGARVELCRS